MPMDHGQTTDQLVGARVRRAMRRRGIGQQAIADRLGVAQATVSRKISGDRAWFSDELVIVADLLGVTVGYLFGEDDLAAPDDDARRRGRAAVDRRLAERRVA